MSAPLATDPLLEELGGTIPLARRRSRIVAGLSALIIVAYFAFMGVFAFDKPLLGSELAPGLTLCLVLGPALILGGILVSLAYVLWANSVFDPMLARGREAPVDQARDDRHAQ